MSFLCASLVRASAETPSTQLATAGEGGRRAAVPRARITPRPPGARDRELDDDDVARRQYVVKPKDPCRLQVDAPATDALWQLKGTGTRGAMAGQYGSHCPFGAA